MRGLALQEMRGNARQKMCIVVRVTLRCVWYHPEMRGSARQKMRVVVRVMQVQEKMLSTSRESDIMRGLSPRKSRGKVS